MKTDNEIFKLIFNRSLLRYFNERFISFEGKTFLVDVDEEDVLLISSSGIQLINDFPEEISLSLSSDQINKFLNSWYSKNRLLKIYTGNNNDYYWLSERLNVTNTKNTELTCLIRDPKYQSMAVYRDREEVTVPKSLGGYHSNFALLSDITELSIPNEEDVNYFKEYYTPIPNFNCRLITP